MSISSFSNSVVVKDSFHALHHLSTKKSIDDNSSQLVIEETNNEDELENGFELQSSFLSFFTSFFKTNFNQLVIPAFSPLVEKLTNPIYISVCNFRI